MTIKKQQYSHGHESVTGRVVASVLGGVACSMLLFTAAPVSAQKLVDISSCASITRDAERYACYDNLARQAGAMPPAQAAQPAQSPPVATQPAPQAATQSAPATAATPATPQANPVVPAAPATPAASPPVATSSDSSRIAAFGTESARAQLVRDKEGQEMLLDTVSAARYYKPDIWQLTLASGQVWRQVNARDFTLRVGDKVQIAPSGWGKSYRLTVEGRSGFLQVERVDKK